MILLDLRSVTDDRGRVGGASLAPASLWPPPYRAAIPFFNEDVSAKEKRSSVLVLRSDAN